ncbi:flagellar protein FliT [Halomonas urumqiensis]|uniref:Flagellar protein FliT n=1 Tax=Halomonas urumqiensis TaxID=1684789 RepID=A0A2N7UK87_9GAMM|nr:flagellar protein FliT [Halomonas urumqiensis]PMR80846.1 flagellar protein [Halomonas urumqiensis]PTB02803.1 flagellar protein FliT [Halomonas urumqiensis]GHE21311.1 hypothetical protein GCM10017767_18320 [Halomonas urumqiensis]
MSHHHQLQRHEPSSSAALLEAYEALLARSSRMLDAARAADWEALIGQETGYVVDVERLRRREAELPLDAAEASRKADLLERILAQDLEIRERLLERREALATLIGSSRQTLALSRAYGPQKAPEVITMDDRRAPKKAP